MYLPSLISGVLIGRFGAGQVMIWGAALLGATLIAGLAGRHMLHYSLALVALGVGWNFLYVGGTSLLVRAHSPAERFRVQALNDFSIMGISVVASLSAGAVIQVLGWNAVLYGSIPAILVGAMVSSLEGIGTWPRRIHLIHVVGLATIVLGPWDSACPRRCASSESSHVNRCSRIVMISSGLGALRSCLTERDPATARPVVHAVVVERFTEVAPENRTAL